MNVLNVFVDVRKKKNLHAAKTAKKKLKNAHPFANDDTLSPRHFI